jgi:hypothetical protein
MAALENLSISWGVSIESLIRRVGELRVVSDVSVRRAHQRLHGMAEFRRDEPIATYRGEVLWLRVGCGHSSTIRMVRWPGCRRISVRLAR